MKIPKVTVLMSVYNAESFINEAVESVLNQTSSDFEFLIFEDKSTDTTLELLKAFNDSRIRLIVNEENQGLTKNLALGMLMARGEYIARMDADDVCLPNRLETQLSYLELHPDISVLGSAVTYFDGTGWEFVAHQPLDHDEIKCTLLYGFTMLHPSVMFRKADFQAHNLNYNLHFRVSQDHDLWTRAIRNLRFANLHQPLLKMREHSGKIGNTRKSYQQDLSNDIRKRQLKELGVEFTEQEFQVFNADENTIKKWTVDDFKYYEAMLLKILEANTKTQIFNHILLVKQGIDNFRGYCRLALIFHNSAGKYYWQSTLKKSDSITKKQFFGLLIRTCFI
ncbi:glycosyltransferase [Methylobacter psychrophilus]|uniref:glycosyltransferase n=1 Tax=Methylobacter psychrophilus TaxID=96941 RepID=UPI0021D4CB81|nr:glycosyltransferase [Methylobacter psychrophilus]